MSTFAITPNTATLPRTWSLRYHVVEGRGSTRTSVSQHRKLGPALAAARRWKAPASVVVLDRETGEAHDPAHL